MILFNKKSFGWKKKFFLKEKIKMMWFYEYIIKISMIHLINLQEHKKIVIELELR